MFDDFDSISRRQLLLGSMGSLGIGAALGTATASFMAPDPVSIDRTTIIGHRGFGGKYPENSMAGIRAAIDVGADGVEMDVRATRDGELVLWHDPVAVTETGVRLINETQYSDLQQLPDRDEPVQSLDTALAYLSTTNRLIVLELKETGITEAVMAKIREHGIIGQAIIVSFASDTIIPAIPTTVRTGLLGAVPNQWLLKEAAEMNTDLVIPHYASDLMENFFTNAREKGVQAGYWALLDDEQSIRDALSTEPDLAITNHPDIALDYLR